MAVGGMSTRGRPRDLVKVVERDRKARARKMEAVLRRRADAMGKDRIARELGLDVVDVAKILEDRRKAGDARALTDKQAAALARRRADSTVAKARAEAVAAAVMAGPPMPAAPEPAPAIAPRPPRPRRKVLRPATLAAFKDADARAWYVDMLRRRGSSSASAGHRGLLHLADLYDHHDTFFPTYELEDGGGTATLGSTDRLFPRIGAPRSTHSSPAALCTEG